MPQARVLIYSATDGFRHESIPQAVSAVRDALSDRHIKSDATEDPSAFTADNLEKYETIIWLSVTGNTLAHEQRVAFQQYIGGGGGMAAIHGTADAERDWPFFGRCLGARFVAHPRIQQATLVVDDKTHPSVVDLPQHAKWTDEWYNFDRTPPTSAQVLLTVDETTYDPGPAAMGSHHPISWCQTIDTGKTWYSALGHDASAYSPSGILSHFIEGILSTFRSQPALYPPSVG